MVPPSLRPRPFLFILDLLSQSVLIYSLNLSDLQAVSLMKKLENTYLLNLQFWLYPCVVSCMLYHFMTRHANCLLWYNPDAKTWLLVHLFLAHIIYLGPLQLAKVNLHTMHLYTHNCHLLSLTSYFAIYLIFRFSYSCGRVCNLALVNL